MAVLIIYTFFSSFFKKTKDNYYKLPAQFSLINIRLQNYLMPSVALVLHIYLFYLYCVTE